MQGFPLTKKRLLSMPLTRRHKWVKKWLEDTYRGLIEDEIATSSVTVLLKQYRLITEWMDLHYNVDLSQLQTKRQYQETLADLVLFHQQQTNLGRSEHDFLPKVKTGDIKDNQNWVPKIDYGIALDNIRSAFNVGSIFRTTDGAGLGFIVLGGYTPDAVNRQVIKTSMGTVNWIPSTSTQNLRQCLLDYKKDGYQIVGVETIENSESYCHFNWPSRAILVFGNEEYGISNEVLSVCDVFIHIPMHGFKNSINIANAFAVIAFSITSQLT